MNYIDLVRGVHPRDTTVLAAEVLVGNSFGTARHKNSVNDVLAGYLKKRAEGRPIIADTMLAQLISGADVHEVRGDISNTTGEGVGSWGVEVAAKAFMDAHSLQVAEQVAHRRHIARVGMQAVKAGILLNTFPEESELPYWFDENSEQVWTRNRGLWMVREAIGIPVLRHQGKL